MILLFLWACIGIPLKSSTPQLVNQIRYQTVEPPNSNGQKLVVQVANSQWDKGLEQAAHQLLKKMESRSARITALAVNRAAASVGFPGQARFAKVLNDGQFPTELVQMVRQDMRGTKSDVALLSRSYGDGLVLWLIGWAPHYVELDPIERDHHLDDRVVIHIESEKKEQAKLYVSPPDGPIQVYPLVPHAHRWVGGFHVPGVYRFEVVVKRGNVSKIALLFSIFIDTPPPKIPTLKAPSRHFPNPKKAEEFLYAELNKLRLSHGLKPLRRFHLFEPLAREHSAYMAISGIVAHKLPKLTQGVAYHAEKLAHPKAMHYENVAAAFSASEAMELAVDSPGHLQALLCQPCSHVSIGASIEPRMGNPRLFVTWEMLEFTQGVPRRIEKQDRE